MMNTFSTFISIAFSREVVKNSLKVSFVVGSVLVLINHGDKIFNSNVNLENFLKTSLNYLVPYCVSTYSSVIVTLNNKA